MPMIVEAFGPSTTVTRLTSITGSFLQYHQTRAGFAHNSFQAGQDSVNNHFTERYATITRRLGNLFNAQRLAYE